jgi:hypothetical protein
MTDRGSLAADPARARDDFHHLLAMVGDVEWSKPTPWTRWTNEQLLFHMVFGYMVVQRLLLLVRVLGLLPNWVGRRFACLLSAATNPFHAINDDGSCWAARVYNRERMGSKMDRVIKALQRSLARIDDNALRGMHFPTRWDPYFRDYTTLADLYDYPGRHYDHRRRQLALANLDQV